MSFPYRKPARELRDELQNERPESRRRAERARRYSNLDRRRAGRLRQIAREVEMAMDDEGGSR
jgi:hypothetical protein